MMVNITESDVLAALRDFLIGILPAGVEVVKGQDNRVAEPQGDNFVVMTPTGRRRLATNVASYADALFTGSINGTTLSVTAMTYGALAVGRTVFGVGGTDGTVITALGSGSGGVGTYTVAPSQDVASVALAAGVVDKLQPTQLRIQLDVHGSLSADNAQTIATLFRDPYGAETLCAGGLDIAPLYTSEPRQTPFINAEQQVENRWVIDVEIQANIVVELAQQFMGQIDVGLIEVDAAYSPD